MVNVSATYKILSEFVVANAGHTRWEVYTVLKTLWLQHHARKIGWEIVVSQNWYHVTQSTNPHLTESSSWVCDCLRIPKHADSGATGNVGDMQSPRIVSYSFSREVYTSGISVPLEPTVTNRRSVLVACLWHHFWSEKTTRLEHCLKFIWISSAKKGYLVFTKTCNISRTEKKGI